MKALFNCSVIKNVYLNEDKEMCKLTVTYLDNQNAEWVSRTTIDKLAYPEYVKEKYNKAYDTIKMSLLRKAKYVEIEL